MQKNKNTILKEFSLKNIHQAAEEFINQIENETVFVVNGKMGAGKTTFIKAVCEVMGVQEVVNSPTFSIVNEYEAANGKTIYHFDCYRINRIEEAMDMGAEEYLYSGRLCFIEWAENIASLLPDCYETIEITELENGKRKVEITHYPTKNE